MTSVTFACASETPALTLNENHMDPTRLDECKGAVSGERCHDVCSCAVPRRRSNGFLNRVLLNIYAEVRGISLEL